MEAGEYQVSSIIQ